MGENNKADRSAGQNDFFATDAGRALSSLYASSKSIHDAALVEQERAREQGQSSEESSERLDAAVDRIEETLDAFDDRVQQNIRDVLAWETAKGQAETADAVIARIAEGLEPIIARSEQAGRELDLKRAKIESVGREVARRWWMAALGAGLVATLILGGVTYLSVELRSREVARLESEMESFERRVAFWQERFSGQPVIPCPVKGARGQQCVVVPAGLPLLEKGGKKSVYLVGGEAPN